MSIGVLSGLGVAFSAIKAWSHSKRNGNETPNPSTVLWFLIFCSGTLGNVFIFVSFCASVHTLVFYKGQAVLHVLLPSETTEENIKIFVIVAFSLKVCYVTCQEFLFFRRPSKALYFLARRNTCTDLSSQKS